MPFPSDGIRQYSFRPADGSAADRYSRYPGAPASYLPHHLVHRSSATALSPKRSPRASARISSWPVLPLSHSHTRSRYRSGDSHIVMRSIRTLPLRPVKARMFRFPPSASSRRYSTLHIPCHCLLSHSDFIISRLPADRSLASLRGVNLQVYNPKKKKTQRCPLRPLPITRS